MTCKEIYDTAISLVAESRDPADTADYEERAPYLLAAFCSELKDTDQKLRTLSGDDESEFGDTLYLKLDSVFPLQSKLSACAALYLAAMLVIDDQPELSDRLYDRYCDSVCRITESISCANEKTVNRYFVN